MPRSSASPAARGSKVRYASAILLQALEIARGRLGLRRLVLTCDHDNLGSIKVIEKNGGVLENVITDADLEKPKRRYWIEIGS